MQLANILMLRTPVLARFEAVSAHLLLMRLGCGQCAAVQLGKEAAAQSKAVSELHWRTATRLDNTIEAACETLTPPMQSSATMMATHASASVATSRRCSRACARATRRITLIRRLATHTNNHHTTT